MSYAAQRKTISLMRCSVLAGGGLSSADASGAGRGGSTRIDAGVVRRSHAVEADGQRLLDSGPGELDGQSR